MFYCSVPWMALIISGWFPFIAFKFWFLGVTIAFLGLAELTLLFWCLSVLVILLPWFWFYICIYYCCYCCCCYITYCWWICSADYWFKPPLSKDIWILLLLLPTSKVKMKIKKNLRLDLLILLAGPLNLVVFCWESCAFSYWKPSLVWLWVNAPFDPAKWPCLWLYKGTILLVGP